MFFYKIVASTLFALFFLQTFQLIAEKLVRPSYLPQNILGIDIGAELIANDNNRKFLEPIGPLLASADAVKGRKIAKKCLQCHSFEKGGVHKNGPNLWGVVMKTVASATEYQYSEALKKHGGVWNYEALNAYLNNPREYIKGTKMFSVGLSDPKERADLIAYLRTLTDRIVPLP